MTPFSLVNPGQIDEMVKLASAVPSGCFVEVGVYKGGTAWHLAKVAREQGRAIHLFDTFDGIPFQDEIDDHEVGTFSDTALYEVMQIIPDARFHVGIFPDTLPDDLQEIAFCHIDCDQYRSVRDCIDELMPRMVSGGIMMFDDWNHTRGATKAITEAFGSSFELTSYFKPYVRK